MSHIKESHAGHRARGRLFVAANLIAVVVGIATSTADAQEYPRAAARAAAGPAAESTVYAYPSNGQSEDQTDRDRYECHDWAVQQTGFDPSGAHVPPHQRVDVVAAPANGPHVGAGVGAATGAALGAVVAHSGNAGPGALIGAALGGIAGGAADAARKQQTQEEVQQVRERESARDAALTEHLEEQSANYRRAITACLQGRGYTVS